MSISKYKSMRAAPLFLTVIFCSLALLIFGFFAFPPPATDAINYLPTAINYRAGKGLVNEIFPIARIIDPLHKGQYLHNLPFFPMFLGFLSWKAAPQDVFLVIAFLNILSLILSAFFFYKISSRKQLPLCLSILGLASSFTGHYEGRPEILGTLLIAILANALLHLTGRLRIILCAVILGAMAASYAIGAILLALILGLYYACVQKPRQAAKSLLMVYLLSLGTFWISLELAPYPPLEILQGIRRHSQLIHEGLRPAASLRKFFLYNNFTFYGFLLITALAAGIQLFLTHRKKNRIFCPEPWFCRFAPAGHFLVFSPIRTL